ncbi:putative DNA topoisomerase (ATP-hydrolyzing) [Lupinus albus]|uniref:DNA topoisomerase (ATP-hydrolyzing) n=1 Tax=Lupinus albus TaxID=3870 RepID=A0A6A4P4P2_LUPAL|nr:putative DNA topoisomerase (ATP-hydrolyzing) [Lupinus albus]
MDDVQNWKLKLFSDQELCYADIIPPSQVRARIEVSVLNFIKILNAPKPAISHLPLIKRNLSNSRVNHGLLTELSCVFLSHSVSTRSLMKPNAAKAFVRGTYNFITYILLQLHLFNFHCNLSRAVWKVMEMCYQILLQEKCVTQRELYYKLLCDSPHLFPSQTDVNRTIQDVVALLRCSRFSLGIIASSRGLIAGRIILQEPGKEDVDCSMCGSSGHTISGDFNLLQKLSLYSDARYIIIVEKHAIFQRLTEDQFFHQIPSILITAKGYPDMATRYYAHQFLVHRISRIFPDLPILCLVDWNPAGLAILCTFKFGSIGMGLEAYRYACNVKWLGLRGHDLDMVPDQSLVPLKPKDLQIAESLISSGILQENYKEEVALMVRSGRRAEIEALYFHGYDYLGKYIAKKIVQSDYI